MALTEEQLKSLPVPIDNLIAKLERDTVDKICSRVNAIGQLTAKDTHALSELARIGADIDSIKSDIAKTLNLTEDEAYNLYYNAAKIDYDFQKTTFEKLGKPWITFEENKQMMSLVESIARTTAGEFSNFSQTTGFMGYIKQKTSNQFAIVKNSEFMTLDEYYQSTINYAILQVRTGVEDFDSVMRKAIKEMSDNGLMTKVEYDNPDKRAYSRRMDSSFRNAFMGGQQRLSQQQAVILGEQFGADGMEITWHSGARPSHQDFAGKQFGMEDYRRDSLPLLEEPNCYHRAFPIVMGVSTPTHTQEELDELNAKELEKHMFEGKEYNKYEATQMQRRFETAIRREKDRAKAFAVSGDKEAERIALAKSAALNAKYNELSRVVGLAPKSNRVTVSGFSRSQAGKLGWETRKLSQNIVLEKVASGEYSLKLAKQQQEKHIVGTAAYNNYFKSRQASGDDPQSILYMSLEEAQDFIKFNAGTGEQKVSKKGVLEPKEFINADKIIGQYWSNGEYCDTIRVTIHYGKRGSHVVPVKEKKIDGKIV